MEATHNRERVLWVEDPDEDFLEPVVYNEIRSADDRGRARVYFNRDGEIVLGMITERDGPETARGFVLGRVVRDVEQGLRFEPDKAEAGPRAQLFGVHMWLGKPHADADDHDSIGPFASRGQAASCAARIEAETNWHAETYAVGETTRLHEFGQDIDAWIADRRDDVPSDGVQA